jgi:hypothetical protein
VILKIGHSADMIDFVAPSYVHGSLTSELMKRISFDVARADLFRDNLACLVNYNHDAVDTALTFLQNTHGGVKK